MARDDCPRAASGLFPYAGHRTVAEIDAEAKQGSIRPYAADHCGFVDAPEDPTISHPAENGR